MYQGLQFESRGHSVTLNEKNGVQCQIAVTQSTAVGVQNETHSC